MATYDSRTEIRDALRQRTVKKVEFAGDGGEIREIRLHLDDRQVVRIAATTWQALRIEAA